MQRVLIIGYGNPMRRDDGLGPHIADMLAERLGDAVQVEAIFQLTPELADPISKAARVIFIDASVEGEAGIIKLAGVSANVPTGALTHHFSPAGLLHLAQTLYGRSAAAQIVTVTGSDFDLGEGFSPAVEAVIPQVVAIISRMVNRLDTSN